ncbi:hypothetical protein P152DRAFT_234893 [Eremomyces bilateralis CBS 781.70]|uniref:DUF4604 domain-containing protein n=1 Tax=Eremomyces bilateralis CBS 781.70 TaxID=1392243 RepID=A0A6G1GA71_9PEZI|nr:uncharacterized protein P152DRAFT_234893 [Eremomyces bilateralis CBS 781.70]KAF1814836.1 hypothetical protein P152DRAFT_234893 [Eremomyces bilateralis CBS 781.70]
MSFKAKNLTYESEDPAFLRRLKGQLARGDTDRHERPLARPKKAAQADEEDEPTYVDEETGDTVSKAEYEALLTGKDVDVKEDGEGQTGEMDTGDKAKGGGKEEVRAEQNRTEIGVQKKRKAGRIIGDEGAGKEDEVKSATTKKPKTKAKKKAKTKLSFEEV